MATLHKGDNDAIIIIIIINAAFYKDVTKMYLLFELRGDCCSVVLRIPFFWPVKWGHRIIGSRRFETK